MVRVHRPDNEAHNNRRHALDDRTQGDTSETVDLLRVVAQVRHQATRAVALLVEELDVLAEDALERERAEAGGELGRGGGERVVLHADADHGDEGDEEEPERVAVAVVAPLVGVELRERIDSLTKDDTKARIHRTIHCSPVSLHHHHQKKKK